MSACLDQLLADCRTGPESRAPEPNHAFVLTDDQCDAMDEQAFMDMADFVRAVKTEVRTDLRAQGWSDSAVSELADIYVGATV